MKRGLAFKLGTIGFLIILLLIPVQMISGLVRERQQHRELVVQDIARSSSYKQRISGPILVVPYHKKIREWKSSPDSSARYQEEKLIPGFIYLLPEIFNLNGKVHTEIRKRGIYEARLYHSDNKVSGTYVIPARWGIVDDIDDYTFGQPYLALGISDIRGIENGLKLQFDGQALNFKPGSMVKQLGDGVHAYLPIAATAAENRVNFAFDLKLQGTGEFNVVPVGADSRVEIHSDWPHPSFIGNYLPVERAVSANGFNARWQTSLFATNMNEMFQNCLQKNECTEIGDRYFGVSFVDPVDQYLKSDRAIKYALLFIALTFAGFFLFEVLKRLAVHPIQYGLVGMALALFYLLLLSLSEHIGFTLAYALSASACVLLIGTYVSSILNGVVRGMGFASVLAALYGMLYGLLSAEDYSLLMGAILLFGLLGAMMMLTRKVDWFTIGKSE